MTKQQGKDKENNNLGSPSGYAGTGKLVEYEESNSAPSSSGEDENGYGVEEEELDDEPPADGHNPKQDYKRR